MTETTTPRPTGRAGEREIEIEGETFRTQLATDGIEYIWEACGKCSGVGYLSWTSMDEARCWECHTRKGRWTSVPAMKRRIRDRARRAERAAAKAAAKVAARDAALAEFAQEHQDLTFLTGDPEVIAHHILADLARKLRDFGSLSDKQIALARRIAAEQVQRAAERAVTPPAPAGRTVVEGEIRSIKFYDGDYGTVCKMLVATDEGWKAFGTVPRSLEPTVTTGTWSEEMEALKGRRVRFTATLEPKADDPTFAIAKRPTKAELADEREADPIDLQDEARGDFTPGH